MTQRILLVEDDAAVCRAIADTLIDEGMEVQSANSAEQALLAVGRAQPDVVLSDVARTAPYMHDGSLSSLEDVVSFYSRGGNPNPNLDPDLKPRGLTADECRDLVVFLHALKGGPIPRTDRSRRK